MKPSLAGIDLIGRVCCDLRVYIYDHCYKKLGCNSWCVRDFIRVWLFLLPLQLQLVTNVRCLFKRSNSKSISLVLVDGGAEYWNVWEVETGLSRCKWERIVERESVCMRIIASKSFVYLGTNCVLTFLRAEVKHLWRIRSWNYAMLDERMIWSGTLCEEQLWRLNLRVYILKKSAEV